MKTHHIVAIIFSVVAVGLMALGIWKRPELFPRIIGTVVLIFILTGVDVLYTRFIAPHLGLSKIAGFCVRLMVGLGIIGLVYLLSPRFIHPAYVPDFAFITGAWTGILLSQSVLRQG